MDNYYMKLFEVSFLVIFIEITAKTILSFYDSIVDYFNERGLDQPRRAPNWLGVAEILTFSIGLIGIGYAKIFIFILICACAYVISEMLLRKWRKRK